MMQILLATAVPSPSVSVRPHDPPLHGLEKLILGCAGGEVEHAVQGVEFEEIAMSPAGRAWPTVAHPPPTILAMAAAIRQLGVRGDPFGETLCFPPEYCRGPNGSTFQQERRGSSAISAKLLTLSGAFVPLKWR